MDIDTDKLLANALREGLQKGVVDKMSGYNSPFDPLFKIALEKHSGALRQLLEDGIASCVTDPGFRSEMHAAMRSALAKTLVQRFGGELEKQVNALKSDPTTRARITLAIEEIVKSKTS